MRHLSAVMLAQYIFPLQGCTVLFTRKQHDPLMGFLTFPSLLQTSNIRSPASLAGCNVKEHWLGILVVRWRMNDAVPVLQVTSIWWDTMRNSSQFYNWTNAGSNIFLSPQISAFEVFTGMPWFRVVRSAVPRFGSWLQCATVWSVMTSVASSAKLAQSGQHTAFWEWKPK